MRSVTEGNTTESYEYDESGRRVARTPSGSNAEYAVYDGANVFGTFG